MDKIVEILEQVVLPTYRDQFDKAQAMEIAAEIREELRQEIRFELAEKAIKDAKAMTPTNYTLAK